ncbi:MAG: AsmA family protein [Halioglobus sp.]
MPRFILILLAIPVLLVVAAALLIPLLLDEQELLAMAAETLKEETGAILTVDGDVELSLFPGISVDLADTGITLPGEQELSVRARSLAIGLALRPLFSGRVEVGEIVIDGLRVSLQSAPAEPVVESTGMTDEQLDAYYAKRRAARDSAGQGSGQEALVALPLALNVQRLAVTDSVLETLSVETGERSVVNIVSLEARDLNLDNRPIPLSLEVHLEGDEESAPITVALNGTLKVDNANQSVLLESLAVEVNGVLASPVTVNAQGVLDLDKQAADLQVELKIGETRGEGSVRYASFESPQIDARLHLNQFDPALMALAGPDAAAAAEDSPAPDSDASGDQPLPLNAIREIDTLAVLSIDSANFSGHVVENMEVKLRALEGIVKINTLTGNVHGGTLDVKAVFNGQHNSAKLNTRGGVTGLEIDKALVAVGSEPIMQGKADLQWRLNSTGTTSNQLIEAMKGPIDLLTSEVILQDVGVEKMLCEAVALANRAALSADLPDNTRFENLSVKMKMNKGKLQLKPLRAELAHVKLQGEGAMDLLQQDFSATFTATLLPSLTTLDPACEVNDRYTSIGWPVNCEGSLAGDPAEWCSVDSAEIIEQMATKEVTRKIEKEAGKYLDKFFKK